MTITKEDKDVKKKIIIAAMAGMLAVAGAGATTAVAKAAGNEETAIATESGDSSTISATNEGYKDSAWELAVNASDNKQVHPKDPKTKYTYSKVYFNWGSVVNGNVTMLDVEPYGYDGSTYHHVGDRQGSAKRYDVKKTGKYAVTNYVRENGWPSANIAIHSKKGSGLVKGVWSPDCAGTYEVLQ